MNDVPRKKLVRIIAEHGKPVAKDARLCKALLDDHLGGESRGEVNVLVSAVRSGVVAALLAAGDTVPMPALLARLAQKLHDETRIAENSARWGVESWAVALGLTAALDAAPLDPTISAITYTVLAEVRLEKKEYDRAIAAASEAIRLDPRNAQACFYRGKAHYQKGEDDRAIADCTEALLLDSKNARALILRGDSYRMKKDFDRAIADCTEAIRLDSKDASAYYTRGDAYRMKRDYDRAIADLSEAIRLDPKDALAYAARGEAHRQKGEYEQAIADLDEALRFNPKNEWALACRGKANRLKSSSQVPYGTADRLDAASASPRVPDQSAAAESCDAANRQLYRALVELRHRLAAERQEKRYQIFPDATLRELARVRPSTLERMRQIHGIGDVKIRDFGDLVLRVIREHDLGHGPDGG